MIGRVGILIIFLQLWQLAMPNRMLADGSQPIQNRTTYVGMNENNFEIHIGNKFYHIESTRTNWYEAAHNCRRMGGNLLNIESSKEMDAIVALETPFTFWISANCLAGNREFTSITTGDVMPYFRWAANEPNNQGGNEKCVTLAKDSLNDDTCTKSFFGYMCEAKLMY